VWLLSDRMDTDLQRLVDEAAIRDTAARYCWALDTLDRPALETVFLPDATAKLGSDVLLEGIDAIWGRIHAALGNLTVSQHLIGSQLVEVTGDTATQRCYLHAQHVREGTEGGSQYIVAGTYIDRLERTPDGWRIRHRDLTVQWTSGNVRVVRP
jgi:hypothetical protein